MRARQRDRMMSEKGQGIYGLAGKNANPTALALAKENVAAHSAEDDAAAYEASIREDANRAFGAAGDAANMEQARRLGVLGITAGPYQSQLGKPKWWTQLLQGAAGAAPMAFGA